MCPPPLAPSLRWAAQFAALWAEHIALADARDEEARKKREQPEIPTAAPSSAATAPTSSDTQQPVGTSAESAAKPAAPSGGAEPDGEKVASDPAGTTDTTAAPPAEKKEADKKEGAASDAERTKKDEKKTPPPPPPKVPRMGAKLWPGLLFVSLTTALARALICRRRWGRRCSDSSMEWWARLRHGLEAHHSQPRAYRTIDGGGGGGRGARAPERRPSRLSPSISCLDRFFACVPLPFCPLVQEPCFMLVMRQPAGPSPSYRMKGMLLSLDGLLDYNLKDVAEKTCEVAAACVRHGVMLRCTCLGA